jgi:hypothetical protein
MREVRPHLAELDREGHMTDVFTVVAQDHDDVKAMLAGLGKAPSGGGPGRIGSAGPAQEDD